MLSGVENHSLLIGHTSAFQTQINASGTTQYNSRLSQYIHLGHDQTLQSEVVPLDVKSVSELTVKRKQGRETIKYRVSFCCNCNTKTILILHVVYNSHVLREWKIGI